MIAGTVHLQVMSDVVEQRIIQQVSSNQFPTTASIIIADYIVQPDYLTASPGDGHFERRRGEQSVGPGGKGGVLPAHVWTQHRLSGRSGNDAADGVHEIPERRDSNPVAPPKDSRKNPTDVQFV